MTKRNSVKQIVEFLDLTVCASEGQIQREVFGYYRGRDFEANKKYADMLRRGLDKGLYNRFEMKVPGMKSRIFYFRGEMKEMLQLVINETDKVKKLILTQE